MKKKKRRMYNVILAGYYIAAVFQAMEKGNSVSCWSFRCCWRLCEISTVAVEIAIIVVFEVAGDGNEDWYVGMQ